MKGIYLLLIIILSSCSEKEYKVKITFCDKREPKIIYVTGYSEPNTNEIMSDAKTRLPSYYGYLNVCEVETIK